MLQTPEKIATLPTSRNAKTTESSEPASPEEMPKVPQHSHTTEEFPKVPEISHTTEEYPKVPEITHASGVKVDFEVSEPVAEMQELNEPVIFPPTLRTPEHKVATATSSFHTPRAERLTITGEEDISSPAAVAALAGSSGPLHVTEQNKQSEKSQIPTPAHTDSGVGYEPKIPTPSNDEQKSVPLEKDASSARTQDNAVTQETAAVTQDRVTGPQIESNTVQPATKTIIPESIVAAPLPPLANSEPLTKSEPLKTSEPAPSKIPSFNPQQSTSQSTTAVAAPVIIDNNSSAKTAKPVKPEAMDKGFKNPLYFNPQGGESTSATESKTDTTTAASPENTANSTKQGTDSSLVSPAKSDVFYEVEDTPETVYETTAVTPSQPKTESGTVKDAVSVTDKPPKEVVAAWDKQSLAAALRDSTAQTSSTGTTDSKDRALEDAVQKQNVAQALREERVYLSNTLLVAQNQQIQKIWAR